MDEMEPFENALEPVTWEEHYQALRSAVGGAYQEEPGHPMAVQILEALREVVSWFPTFMAEEDERHRFLGDPGNFISLILRFPVEWDWEAGKPILPEVATPPPELRTETETYEMTSWGPRMATRKEAAAYAALSKGLAWIVKGEEKVPALLHGFQGLTPFPKDPPPAKDHAYSWSFLNATMAESIVKGLGLPGNMFQLGPSITPILPPAASIGGGAPVVNVKSGYPFEEDLARLMGAESGAWADLRTRGEIKGHAWESRFSVTCRGLEVDKEKEQARFIVEVAPEWGEWKAEGDAAEAAAMQERDTMRSLALEWGPAEWTAWTETVGQGLGEALRRLHGGGAILEGKAKATSSLTGSLADRRFQGPEWNPQPIPKAALYDYPATPGDVVAKALAQVFNEPAVMDIPDLSLDGELATQEAERLFLVALRERLEKWWAGKWRESLETTGERIFDVDGAGTKEAEEDWASASKRMNKEQGGPGVEVKAKPTMEPRAGGVRLIIPAVRPVARFRTAEMERYVALREERRATGKPYFREGAVCFMVGDQEESWTLGGQGAYLFQSLRNLTKLRDQTNIEDFSRVLAHMRAGGWQPPLIGDPITPEKVESSIYQAQLNLSRMSKFDRWLWSLQAILRAFWPQRDHWARQELALPDGRVVKTPMYHLIRLDPYHLKDLFAFEGQNWRGQLWDHLEVLAMLQRGRFTRKGRRIELGETMVRNMVDGLTGEEALPITAGRDFGLVRVLREAGALPLDAFFLELSPAFLDFFYAWEFDQATGKVHWGSAAITMKTKRKRAELRAQGVKGLAIQVEVKTYRREEEAKAAYYAPPAFLQAVASWEKWPDKRWKLADFAMVTQGRAHGPTVREWMERGTYRMTSGPDGGLPGFKAFRQDLRFLVESLGFTAELSSGHKDLEAVAHLDTLYPRAKVYPLRMKLRPPEDLEEMCRTRTLQASQEREANGTAKQAEEPRHSGSPVSVTPAALQAAMAMAKQRDGLTQAHLAQVWGLTRENLNRMARGKLAIPKDREVAFLTFIRQYAGL